MCRGRAKLVPNNSNYSRYEDPYQRGQSDPRPANLDMSTQTQHELTVHSVSHGLSQPIHSRGPGDARPYTPYHRGKSDAVPPLSPPHSQVGGLVAGGRADGGRRRRLQVSRQGGAAGSGRAQLRPAAGRRRRPPPRRCRPPGTAWAPWGRQPTG